MTRFLQTYWAPVAFGVTAVVALALALALRAEWPLGWIAVGWFGVDSVRLTLAARAGRRLRLGSPIALYPGVSVIFAVTFLSVGEKGTALALGLTCIAFALLVGGLWHAAGRPGGSPLGTVRRRLEQLRQDWT